MFKELINKIYEFINDINTIKEDLKNKEVVIVKLNEKISQNDTQLEEKNKKIEELEKQLNSQENSSVELKSLEEAINKLKEIING